MAENKPAHKVKYGAVSATTWEKKIKGKDGKEFTVYNTEIVRNYKNGDKWEKTSNFQKNDLPKVEVVTRKAFEWLGEKNEEEE